MDVPGGMLRSLGRGHGLTVVDGRYVTQVPVGGYDGLHHRRPTYAGPFSTDRVYKAGLMARQSPRAFI